MSNLETDRPVLSRRMLLRAGMATLAGYELDSVLRPVNVAAARKVQPRGAAECCIWVFLKGGAPQLDTWDLKEGAWTPGQFEVRRTPGGILWPYGQFPKLAQWLPRVAIARGMETWESAHNRAQYYMQVGHIISPARVREMPAVGSVIAHEFAGRRKDSDYLPPYVVLNYGNDGLIKEGCLPAGCSPFSMMTQRPSPFLVADAERERLDRRWALLRDLEGNSGKQPLEFSTHGDLSMSARRMMSNPALSKVMTLPEAERARYGGNAFGDACLLARQLVAARAGVKHILLNHDGWDLHAAMYNPKGRNHYTLCKELDDGLSALLADLDHAEFERGSTLLDKTFVLCMGEFGRTGGPLTVNAGRDHNRYAMCGLFAGAGVIGGQVFGATGERGEKVTSSDWQYKRSIYPEDVVCTIYSQLGIDWTKRFTPTPSGRAFEYVEMMSGTNVMKFDPIGRLFA